MPRLQLIPRTEFERAFAGRSSDEALALLADMCRANALVAVKRCRPSGPPSARSTWSSTWFLGAEHGRTCWTHPDRDVFFTSKGHDVPGLYAALHALGLVPSERLRRTPAARRLRRPSRHRGARSRGELRLSRHGHLEGPRGWRAKRHLGRGGRVVVMTGDGELQEGQNWEALQGAAQQRLGNLWVIVDGIQVRRTGRSRRSSPSTT